MEVAAWLNVTDELKLFPFRLAPDSESVLKLQLGDKVMTPPEVSAHILLKLRQDAEEILNCSVTQAVITVPAYFQRRAAASDQRRGTHRRFGSTAPGQ